MITISHNVHVKNGAYAITGGLGGLGLRAAAMLVALGATGIALSSRSGRVGGLAIDAEKSALMRVAACDVGDASDALVLMACAAPTGVLHAAGVLHDKMLRFMTADDVHAVFAAKARGGSHIRAIALHTPLEAFGLFSSVASTFGNVGQGNYAAANAYLDAVARSRRRHGALVSSLQIPAVSGSGMGATTFDTVQLEAMGAISPDEFASCLSVALAPRRTATDCTLAPLARAFLASTALLALSELSYEKRERPILGPTSMSFGKY